MPLETKSRARAEQSGQRFRSLLCESLEDRALLATDINLGPVVLDKLVEAGGIVYYMADDTVHGRELWRTDGSAAGTYLLKDISPGNTNSDPSNLTNFSGTLFFSTFAGANGSKLWKTDGTPTGTVLVKDFSSGSGNSAIIYLVSAGSKLLVFLQDSLGDSLWSSDGTTPGTVLVKDGFEPKGMSSSSPVNVNGTIFFAATEHTNGRELWKSDGTTSGTGLVKDIFPGTSGSSPQLSASAAVNATLFFRARNSNGFELWKSDGTSAGTGMVKDINTGPGDAITGGGLVAMNGLVYFHASDGTSTGLWKSDGTDTGTVLVKNPAEPFSPRPASVNGMLFFEIDSGSGIELWKSDGTVAGTVLVKSFAGPGPGIGNPFLGDLNGTLLFKANDGATGIELWKSDGTAAGTVLVSDIRQGSASSSPSFFATTQGVTLFSALVDDTNRVLWRASGAASPTLVGMRTPESDLKPTDDTFLVRKDTALSVDAAHGVLANDKSLMGQPLTALLVAAPSAGIFTFRTDGSFDYTPPAGFIGTQIFTYQLTDGQSASSNVSAVLNVVPPNHAPTSADLEYGIVLEGNGIIWTFTASDFPFDDRLDTPANKLLGVKIVAPPALGSLKRNGVAVVPGDFVPVGKLSELIFAADKKGLYTIQFQVQDDGGTVGGGVDLDPVVHKLTFVVAPLSDFLRVYAEDGPHTSASWAQLLFPTVPPGGSPDLSFLTTNNNPALFSKQPAIDSTGKLTFTPTPNSQGKARVTVVKINGSGEGEEPNGEPAFFEIEVAQRYPWQNDNGWPDTNDDGFIAPIDVLLVIDYINGYDSGPAGTNSDGPYYDTSGDGSVSPIDALGVINLINSLGDAWKLPLSEIDIGQPEGESGPESVAVEPRWPAPHSAPAPLPATDNDLLALLAADQTQLTTRRRK